MRCGNEGRVYCTGRRRSTSSGSFASRSPAELHRVYPPVSSLNGSPNTESNDREPSEGGGRTGTELAVLRREVELLREQLDNRDESIRDLRSRLDAESGERRTAQAQLTALLTDQRSPPAKVSWWWWWPRRG